MKLFRSTMCPVCRRPTERRSLIPLFYSSGNDGATSTAVLATTTTVPANTTAAVHPNCQTKQNVIQKTASPNTTSTVVTKRVPNRRAKQNAVQSTATSNTTAIVVPKRISQRRGTQQEWLNYKKTNCIFCYSPFISATNQIVCDRCIRHQ